MKKIVILVVVAVFCTALSICKNASVYAAEKEENSKSFDELIDEVHASDLQSLREMGSLGALLEKIYNIEFIIMDSIVRATESVVTYIEESPIYNPDIMSVSLDLYSSAYLRLPDDVSKESTAISIDDNSIIKVAYEGNQIKVTGLARGKSVLYLESGDKVYEYRVEVKKDFVSAATYTIKMGKKKTITIPSGCKGYRLSSKKLASVVSYDYENGSIIVKGVKAGILYLYAFDDNGQTTKYTLKIKE